MISLFVGIDPGLKGAVAAISRRGKLYRVWDTPVTKAKGGYVYLPYQMAGILGSLRDTPEVRIVMTAVEQVHSMPKQGVRSMFRMGHGLGLWEGVIAGLGLQMEQVTPQAWKKAVLAAGTGGDKGASIARAQAIVPGAAQQLTLKKHDGRADAILIAEYLRRRMSSDSVYVGPSKPLGRFIELGG